MALRLGEWVVCGELFNTQRYSVRGWLGLCGQEQPLAFELTGNCDPDLAGWHIRFEARGATKPDQPSVAEELGTDAADPGPDLSNVAWSQIGPTGTMTAARRVRVADCPPEELYRRCQLGEPPPTHWRKCLFLEWFGQNGRVVVEIVDPVIEFLERIPLDSTAAGALPPPESPAAEIEAADAAEGQCLPETGLSITSLRLDENGNAEISDEIPFMDDAQDQNVGEEDDDDPVEAGDGYNLIPQELQQQFDAETRETDRGLAGEEDKPRSLREMELMDDLIENHDGELLASLFEIPIRFARPEQLDDQQIEQSLKTLLAELALYNVALHVCEHFTPRETYRLLLEQICNEERAFPQLRGTQWVQHFSTSDFCQRCETEVLRDYEELRHRESPEDTERDPSDADPPPDDGFGDDLC
jgi:hypothetical protein